MYRLRCRYAHRMSTTRSHAPITAVARHAGVDVFDLHHRFDPSLRHNTHLALALDSPTTSTNSTNSSDSSAPPMTPPKEVPHPFVFENREEEERWWKERDEKMEKLRARREARRTPSITSVGKGVPTVWKAPSFVLESCDEEGGCEMIDFL